MIAAKVVELENDCWLSSSPPSASWPTPPTASRTRPPRCSSSRAVSSSRPSASSSSTSPARWRVASAHADRGLRVTELGAGLGVDDLYPSRKASIYGESNEDRARYSRSPARSWASEGHERDRDMDFAWTPRDRPPRRRRGVLKGYDAEHRREDTKTTRLRRGHVGETGRDGHPRPSVLRGRRRHGRRAGEVSVVAEEFGRVVAPEPFVEAVVSPAASWPHAAATSRRRRSSAASPAGRSSLPSPGPTRPAARKASVSTVTTLTGVKEPVLNGGRADTIIVFAEGRLFLVDGAATERTSYRTFDGGRAAGSGSTRPPPRRWATLRQAQEGPPATPPRRPSP